MKNIVMTILLISAISMTACSKKPKENVMTSEIRKEETREDIETSVVTEEETVEDILESVEQQSAEDSTDEEEGNSADVINTIIQELQVCEGKISILEGKEYDCDFMLEYEGYIYGYELEDVKGEAIENYKVTVDFEMIDDKFLSSEMRVPVKIRIDQIEYTIGSFKVRTNIKNEIKSISYYTGYGVESYAKTPDWITEQGAMIRKFDFQNHTAELRYVELVEYDTYVGGEMIGDEWITVPMSEDIKIMALSQSGTGCCYVTEEVINEYMQRGEYFFCYIKEENGELTQIGQVLNP